MDNNKPVEGTDVKIGSFSGAIFLNEYTKDGRTFTIPSVAFQKSWKSGEEWKRQKMSFLNPLEIDKAVTALLRLKDKLYDNKYGSSANDGVNPPAE